MKVITAQAMAQLEAQAFQMGYSDQQFMERAGLGITECVVEFVRAHQLDKNILLLCGKGNNAGDAFVAGFHLLTKHYRVCAILAEPLENCSKLCQENGRRFLESGGQLVGLDQMQAFALLIDGLFGTGFKGSVQEPYQSLINAANRSHLPILSVDIPSGLNGSTGQAEGCVIKATKTIFLGLLKTGFFLHDGLNYTGKLYHVDFGLPESLVDQVEPAFELLTHERILSLLPEIKRTRHKYEAGYVVGLTGSPSMPGAALLSALAALRAGCGIVRLMHSAGMEAGLAASPYEIIKQSYDHNHPEELLKALNKAKGVYVGPGLGHQDEMRQLLATVLPAIEKPCVVDADALTLYAEGSFALPKQSILTPHTGEMQALLQQNEKLLVSLDTLETVRRYVEQKQVTLILKGAASFIFHPGESIKLSIRGDPAMATAGSGDVLTGIVASLLAQGLSCPAAAQLGTYLHGLAGEWAVKQRGTSRGLIASDIINHLNEAYRQLAY